MPFNICCFTRITFSHHIKGGMELHTRVLSEELVSRGHLVTILTTSLEPMQELVENENGVEIHYLPVRNPARYSQEFFDLTIKRFRKLHHSKPFEIIWSESAGAVGYVKKLRKKYNVPMFTKLQGSNIGNILTLYRAAGNCRNGITAVLRNFPTMLRQFITWYIPLVLNSRVLICPSPQTAFEVKAETLSSNSKIYVSINGVDTEKFRPDTLMRKSCRSRLGLTEESFFILNVGRLTSDKGVDILIRAMAELVPEFPNLTLSIIGVGNERECLEQLTQKLNISDNVRFLGYVPNEKLPEYYNACDLFVCPTVRVESFGIVIAEAMACGKPVVCSATGGTKYVVEDRINGLLVPVRRVMILAEFMKKIITNRTLAYELGQQARRRALNHLSSHKMASDTELVMERILDL